MTLISGLIFYDEQRSNHSYANIYIKTDGYKYTFLFDRNPIRYDSMPGTVQGKSIDGTSNLIVDVGRAEEFMDSCGKEEYTTAWFIAKTNYGDRPVCYLSTGAYGAKVDIKLAYMYLKIDGQNHHIGVGPPATSENGGTYETDIDLETTRTIMESLLVSEL